MTTGDVRVTVSSSGDRGRSPLFTAAGVVALVAMAVLTAVGYHAWWPVIATAVLVVVPWMIGRMTAKRNWE